ncbi:MAG: hypothetical protein JXR94_08255, partial [Candidatus Hydrogenedentes bacterium]|nr:hypothetical protein [Candidatus Hydrogenedentota bacterium]
MTFRSVVIGLVLIPANALWLMLSEIMWYSGEPTTISLFYNVVFIIALIVLANFVAKRYKPAWALSGPEILVVYTMLCISSALASHDMIQIIVPTLSHLHRFAPLEGRYAEFMGQVPEALVVRDEAALQSAYLGQESIFSLGNLTPWIGPLAWWFCFILALCAVMWGLNLVFRKQWTENEKLSYPIIQVPISLATQPMSLFRNRLFWLAFGIAAGIDILNGLNVLFPMLPKIPVVHIVNIQQFFPERPWRDMGQAFVSFYPFAIGMCFFMPLDLAFSCWFFYIFWKLERVAASHIGVHGMPGFPFIEEQTAGGYYALALIALWVTRHHLKRLARILTGRPPADTSPWDRQEAWTAVILIAAGGTFLMAFSIHFHMSPHIAALFFLLYFLTSIAVTRMRAELGPPCHDLHHIGPDRQIIRLFGAANLRNANPADLTMFGFLNFLGRAYRGHPMPHGLEGFRIAERLKMDNRRYLIAMGLAIVVGTVSAFFAMLWVFNKYGASAQVLGPGEWFGRETWDHVNLQFTSPSPHQPQPTYAIIIGVLSGLGLAALRMNLAWWPFHPVGYAISGSWSMDQLWACIFSAW